MVNPEFVDIIAEKTSQDQVDLFNYNGMLKEWKHKGCEDYSGYTLPFCSCYDFFYRIYPCIIWTFSSAKTALKIEMCIEHGILVLDSMDPSLAL